MKKSNISTFALLALIGIAYVWLGRPNNDAPADAASSHACDPNYSGCVPIASDVDCAGGPGNGPEYVQGPIRVIGRDIYHLDRDGDGIGCE